jgi:hypothetical protein
MKQLLYILFSLFCLTQASYAATLSGTVYNSGSCTPATGIMVYARDSGYNNIDSAVTNSAGFYSINIPSTLYPTAGGIIHVNTPFVGGWTVYKPGLDAYCNLATAPGASSYGIIDVYAYLGAASGTSQNIQAGKIWLIRREVDPVTLDTTLTAIDSSIYATRFNSSYPFATICRFLLTCWSTSDRYLVKSALLPSDPAYSSYLPTYSDSALVWNASSPISLPSATGSVNIYMKQGANPGGPGFVGGSVVLGANKNAGVGDPLSSRMLLLTKSNGQAVGYTYSDASGKFQFSNLAVGTYKIFGDAAGKANPPLTVTISAGSPSISNIIFEENSKKFEGHFASTGIATISNAGGVSVYPNPAKDMIKVQGLGVFEGVKTLILTNPAGQEVSRQEVKDDQGQIPSTLLPAGVYILEVRTNTVSSFFRVVK